MEKVEIWAVCYKPDVSHGVWALILNLEIPAATWHDEVVFHLFDARLLDFEWNLVSSLVFCKFLKSTNQGFVIWSKMYSLGTSLTM